MIMVLLHICLVYFQMILVQCVLLDYFTEDFETKKNCLNEEQISYQLKNNDGHCTSHIIASGHVDKSQELAKCQKVLSQKINIACGGKYVKYTGILSYCIARGQMSCCFSNHTCNTFNDINDKFGEEADKYLNNRKYYLQDYLVRDAGYKTCHHLKNYDATPCSEDCKSFEKSKFATSCRNNSGLFKCCIRRDAVCDQCRFCCTLPMCTYKDNITRFDIVDKSNITSTRKSSKNAKEIYNSDTFLYKSYDYRCLKPHSHKNPEKWRYYDMSKFRTAVSKQDLSKLPTYKFNKYYFNYYDRDVLKKYLSQTNYKLFKKIYGYDYCTNVPKSNLTKVSIQCIKAETSKWAKKCRKKKGLFKCCAVTFFLHKFEELNIKYWKNMGLQEKPHQRCWENKAFKNCTMGCATYICTKQDKGKLGSVSDFKTTLDPGQNIGGIHSDTAPRISWCVNQDYCTELNSWDYYDPVSKYHEATTQTDVCKLPRKDILGSLTESKGNRGYERIKNNTITRCLEKKKKFKRSNINVKLCSSKNLKQASKNLKDVNINLKRIRKIKKKKSKVMGKDLILGNKKQKKKERIKNNLKTKKAKHSQKQGWKSIVRVAGALMKEYFGGISKMKSRKSKRKRKSGKRNKDYISSTAQKPLTLKKQHHLHVVQFEGV